MEVKQSQWKAWLYLAPTIILLIIFTFYPIVNTFITSFLEGAHYTRVGLVYDGINVNNYIEVLTGSNMRFFNIYLKNTALAAVISVPVAIIVSLLIAVALNSIPKFQKILQTIFFLPYVTNTIAIGMVFSVMFESNQGLINTIISFFGGNGVNWLGGNKDNIWLFEFAKDNKWFNSQYFTSLIVLLVYIVWNSLPFKILILLSALQSVDKQYYQAAQIDGTSKMRTFMKITVPLLSPQIFYLLITSFIGAFKEYTSVVAIFGENASSVGERNNMATVVWYIYRKLKEGGDAGAASAGAVVLFGIILIFTLINNYVSKKRVHY